MVADERDPRRIIMLGILSIVAVMLSCVGIVLGLYVAFHPEVQEVTRGDGDQPVKDYGIGIRAIGAVIVIASCVLLWFIISNLKDVTEPYPPKDNSITTGMTS